MIKPEFQKLEDIVEDPTNFIEILEVGFFYFKKSEPVPPSWIKGFFGNTLNNDMRILTASARGVLIVPITRMDKKTYFAVSFGFGRHLLKDDVVEERFGLKVVLNSLNKLGFRSIDKTTLGSIPKHSREQISKDVAAIDFGIDIEQDLIRSITGKSDDEIFGKIITGKDCLSGTAKIDTNNVVEFLTHVINRYESEDYKEDYGWVDQITEISNKKTENTLNIKLIEKLNTGDFTKVWMAVPEIIDWSKTIGFRYSKLTKADIFDDLDIEEYMRLNPDPVTLESIKNLQVFSISATSNDTIIERWSMFRCLYAEIELEKDEVHILNNSKWYKISKDFTQQVHNDFIKINRSKINMPECCVSDEGEYNLHTVSVMTGSVCMDKKMISHGGGRSKIEFCDIYTDKKEIIHVKRYGGSSVLSHLFAQGVVSGELLINDSDFKNKLNDKLPLTHKISNPTNRLNAGDYEIIYAIISDSDSPLDIPFFSKVSLRNSYRRLINYGYKVSIKQIKKISL